MAAFTEPLGVLLIADGDPGVVCAGRGDRENVVAGGGGHGLQPRFGGEVAGELDDDLVVGVHKVSVSAVESPDHGFCRSHSTGRAEVFGSKCER
ncbi:hypothetical protein [Amycolatopsis sp. cmx-8-4]|uniref:hypothetical protein n=1 Tax=Amycolatopsis sp. cmx-8-4 TaxID=2790947 RepID=UPI00397E26FB